MSNEIQVQEVLGQFAVLIEGEVKLFPTDAAARTAAATALNGEAQLAEATAYAEAQGLEGKNAKAKINQVVDYLAWVDAGRPIKEVEEVAVDAADATEVAAEEAGEEDYEEQAHF